MSINEEELAAALASILLSPTSVVEGLDDGLISYLAGLLSDGLSLQELATASYGENDNNPVYEAMAPFLESSGCSEELIVKACVVVNQLALRTLDQTTTDARYLNKEEEEQAQKLKQGVVSMSSNLDSQTDAEVDASRFLWGTDSGVSAFTNVPKDAFAENVSAKDKRKQRQELERIRKEYEAKVRALEEEEKKEGKTSVSAMVLPDYQSGRNERDIQVHNVGLSLDSGRSLLDHAELRFAYKRRYGLVGKNGIGKTTLLKAIASMEIEGFPRHHRVLHVRQEVRASGGEGVSVLQAVLESDVERNVLLVEEKAILSRLEGGGAPPIAVEPSIASTSESLTKRRERLLLLNAQTDFSSFELDIKRLDEVYARLTLLSSDSAESRAAMILSGLQFTPDMQSGPMSALSGGWRMRVSLAAALFIEPDFLMLDEPTNHLDLEAVLWLESYLVGYKHTIVVVSHDRGFLNEVCTDIIEFKNKKLTYFKGNYDTYVKTSDDQIKNQMRVYQAYQDKRQHLMDFIEKFRANAKRASLVQSRIKAVEKMDMEAPEAIEVEPIWRFSIPNPEPLGRPIISIDNASFDYRAKTDKTKTAPSDYLLQKVNFGIDLTSRIGILGPNGCGKSTLLNLITGKLDPINGSVSRNARLRIGTFTQHSADKFNLHMSSVENMMAMFDGAGDQEMRSFLGKFQIQGSDALKPMMMLSGGQKSRVAFANLAYQKPHVILMDEPTNHLDMESIDALVEAVKDFRGGLIVVSHDQFFITSTCSELWVVGEGKATRYRGDFLDYKKYTLERTAKRVAESVKSLNQINN